MLVHFMLQRVLQYCFDKYALFYSAFFIVAVVAVLQASENHEETYFSSQQSIQSFGAQATDSDSTDNYSNDSISSYGSCNSYVAFADADNLHDTLFDHFLYSS